ncbi:PadR family transcriptional regulator [Spiractinospora alimapuensis]|uniref:PadR family transcriptional regulator n=1 Tax=Spiractinospora alimapuensis TaxID=2820884 RepID=UPI001F3B0458|nr:PadR family transcriptional regulator [Spiractinospora alimapuensis]QVQ54385.1 PadR family transcriptional regulator [Spiractinospora alimapuensis]
MGFSKADRDLVGLSVLGLLLAGPKHTYEMHRMMVCTRKDFVTGLPRSMYHAVDRLQRAGLITAVKTVRDGSTPERTVYAITDRGAADVRDRIERLIAGFDPDTTLLAAALSFVGCLPPRRATEALRRRRDALAQRIEDLRSDLGQARNHLPRVLFIETEFDLSVARSQHAWVQDLVRDLDTNALTWPTDVARLVDGIAGGSQD